ncbi:flavoprotein [Methylovorus sp. MM2]|uniref:flavoprotein n=1 Tax=Methylovorus sp. MM2 TaxID=1848038 RepID=UPI0007E0860D|nr:flavoprotein [Methylovorus sp. MM2]OAM53092.1 flavoprotein [Methylovorus sp. MM2]
MKPIAEQKLAWAITGSGHYLRECIDIIQQLENVDLFLSKAAAEILQQYGYKHNVSRVFQDKTASAVPVEFFYHGDYHTVVIAPATSNTVAKMVAGISDTLVTNVYAQAGKCRVPSIVFACDTEPELESEAPHEHMVKVYPRRIDIENMEKLKTFEETTVVSDMQQLNAAIQARLACLKAFSS